MQLKAQVWAPEGHWVGAPLQEILVEVLFIHPEGAAQVEALLREASAEARLEEMLEAPLEKLLAKVQWVRLGEAKAEAQLKLIVGV